MTRAPGNAAYEYFDLESQTDSESTTNASSRRLERSNTAESTSSISRQFDLLEEEKCRELFQALDVKGTGKLRRKSMLQALERDFQKTKLDAQRQQLKEFVNLMTEEAGSKSITYKQFREIYKRHLLNNRGGSDTHQRSSIAVLLTKTNSNVSDENIETIRTNDDLTFTVWFHNHQVEIWWMTIYVLLNVASLVWKYHRYCYLRPSAFALSGRGLCVARGMAQVCLLNALLVLLPLCRGLMQFLRGTVLHQYIPFDHAIVFHKITGYMFVVAGLIHTLGQVYSYFTRVVSAPDDVFNNSSLGRSGAFPGPQPNFADLLRTLPGWSGVILTAASLIATPFTFAIVRRNNFNWFWYFFFSLDVPNNFLDYFHRLNFFLNHDFLPLNLYWDFLLYYFFN